MAKMLNERNFIGAIDYGYVEQGLEMDPTDEVQRAGFRNTHDRVEELLQAGRLIRAGREERYSEPTVITSRHYGEIDRTIADEKIEILKQSIRTKAKKEQEDRERRLAEQEEKRIASLNQKAEPAPQGSGVS